MNKQNEANEPINTFIICSLKKSTIFKSTIVDYHYMSIFFLTLLSKATSFTDEIFFSIQYKYFTSFLMVEHLFESFFAIEGLCNFYKSNSVRKRSQIQETFFFKRVTICGCVKAFCLLYSFYIFVSTSRDLQFMSSRQRQGLCLSLSADLCVAFLLQSSEDSSG